MKPVEPARLDATVRRLQQRVRTAQPALNEELLVELARAMNRGGGTQALRWLRASVGNTVRMIDVATVVFLRSEEKYTLVAYRDEAGKALEAVVRTPLKDLAAQLDGAQFAQVHRSVVVNLSAVSHVTRGENETAELHLKGGGEALPVSRAYLHLFKQM